MFRHAVLLSALLVPAACGTMPPAIPDYGRLTAAQLGSGPDPDAAAANLAAWAFADSNRTYGRPVEAARAVASLDYIAGQFYASARWSVLSAPTQEQLLQARQDARAALGIPLGTPSQAVIDHLTAAGNALADNNRAAALAALSGPTFTTPPDEVLARLSNLPFLSTANIATTNAANELLDGGMDTQL